MTDIPQNLEKDGAYTGDTGFSPKRDSDVEFKKVEKQCLEFYPKGELTKLRKRRWYWEIETKDIINVADFCFNKLGCRFSIASGTDTPRGFTILYHFSLDRIGLIINIRVTLPHDNPEVDSLTSLGRGFEWIEREMLELLGIKFKGLDDTRHLLLPEDSPPDYHPLRRPHG
ncbi:NADH-quinone oxidoreductase subunit C [candidate division WOR-3 bacterium]|nr:NADH-quinone oxidoreductase subunit C [candidate division WOR-3 bacterium]